MKKKILVLVMFLTGFSLPALEHIEVLLIQQATTPQLKKTVREYLLKIAQDHRSLAEKYKSIANNPKGGKASIQENHKLEMIKLAKKFEDDAKHYEEEANNLK